MIGSDVVICVEKAHLYVLLLVITSVLVPFQLQTQSLLVQFQLVPVRSRVLKPTAQGFLRRRERSCIKNALSALLKYADSACTAKQASATVQQERTE